MRVHWSEVFDEDEAWGWRGVLYALLVGPRDRVAYIGMAWRSSLRERWRRKPDVWRYITEELGYREHVLLVGEPLVAAGPNLTEKLLRDAESLLIYEIQPPANVQCVRSRTTRPGLSLRCTGDWHHSVNAFTDRG